jgi:drug/metabolite transporter (DMT)-like permease
LAVHTSSNSATRTRNDKARFSVVFGVLSLAAIPLAFYATRLENVNVPQGVAGEAVAGTILGLIAVLLARGARIKVERTLSRTGEGTVRLGKWLGLLGLCLGLTAALSLAFYGLLLWSE